ncbi:hypothetical protein D3C85_1544860 [compost metagenome]
MTDWPVSAMTAFRPPSGSMKMMVGIGAPASINQCNVVMQGDGVQGNGRVDDLFGDRAVAYAQPAFGGHERLRVVDGVDGNQALRVVVPHGNH